MLAQTTSLQSTVGEAVARGAAMLSHATDAPFAVPAGTVLVDAGGRVRDILVLRSGWAMRAQLLHDGRRSIFDLYLPGDLMGCDGALGKSFFGAIIALTPLTCQAVRGARLLELVKHPDVALSLWNAGAQEQARIDALAVTLARGTAEERIATFLLNINYRLEREELAADGAFRLPMTQTEIGDHLGITVVHVNRVLQRLRARGVVSLHGSTAVIDVPGLMQIAGSFLMSHASHVTRARRGADAPDTLRLEPGD